MAAQNTWESHLNDVCEVKKGEKEAVMEAAIVGKDGCVWIASGRLKMITADEVKMLTSPDRSAIYMGKLTLGGEPCTVLRDWYEDEGTIEMQTKAATKEDPTFSISLASSKTALIIVKGLQQVHAGLLGPKAIKKANYLKSVNM